MRTVVLAREFRFESGLVLPEGTACEVYAHSGAVLGLTYRPRPYLGHSFAALAADVRDPEEDARWRLATPEEQAVRPCRASPQHRCPNTVAAALNRGRYTQTGRTDAWWFYCPDHLYGRRIQNGRILHRRLIPNEQ